MVIKVRQSALIAVLTMSILSGIGKYFPDSILSAALFAMAILLPGALLVLLFKIRSTWLVRLFLAIPLGLLYCICIGLLANFIGPVVHLSLLSSPLISVCAILGYIPLIYFNNKSFKLTKPSLKHNDYLNIFLGLSTIVISIFGAIILNNGGSGWVAFCTYILFGLSILLVTRRSYEKSKTGIVLLILQGVALVLAYSVRNAHISGSDINHELQVARLTQVSGHWSLWAFSNVYNACLSIALLPVVLSNISGTGLETTFKLFLPIVFVAILVVVYSLSKKFDFDERKSLLAVAFFMAQQDFVNYPLIPIRQEIALLFFGGTLLAFVIDNKKSTKRLLFMLMGVGMVLSHYSTTYIAIALYALFVLFRAVVIPLLLRARLIKTNLKLEGTMLGGRMLLLLFLFVFFWYGQATIGLSGLTSFIKVSVHDVPSIFTSGSQANGQSVVNQFGFAKTDSEQQAISNFVEHAKTFPVQPLSPSDVFTGKSRTNITEKLSQIRGIVELASKLIIILGAMTLFYKTLKHGVLTPINQLAVSSLVLLAILILAPFLAQNYGFDRVYQQLLIVFAPVGIYLLFIIGDSLRHRYVVAASFILVYFILMSYAFGIWTGGPNTPLTLSSNNLNYAQYASSNKDVLAANWLIGNHSGDSIYTDSYSLLRLQIAYNSSPRLRFNTDFYNLVPHNKSYIYTDTTNNTMGLAISTINNTPVYYQFPASYLNADKNVVYTNSGSKVYK